MAMNQLALTLLLLVLCLSFPPPAPGTHHKPSYQPLILADHSHALQTAGSPTNHAGFVSHRHEGPSITAPIFSRDEPSSPFRQANATLPQLLRERLKRDALRVEAINNRLQLALKRLKQIDLKPSDQSTSQYTVEGFSSPIVSGLPLGSGEYFTRIGVGTPPTQSYLSIDTGSDLSWIQCTPCSRCYPQTYPFFNPATSSSFRSVPCTAAVCSQLLVNGCVNNECIYEVYYGDGSFTIGNFAFESLSVGGTVVKDIGIGCGHDNEGLFRGASGLLGLGRETVSFPSQVASLIQSKFSYCLADRLSGRVSSLIFGNGAVPATSSFAPLLQNPKLKSFYYVPLSGISVGGVPLSISPSLFNLAPTGTGGVILDSGTAVTRLVAAAYTALRDAFRAGTRNLRSAGTFSLLDTCYALRGLQSVTVPTIDLHFGNGATMALPAANYLVLVDAKSTYCLSFAPTSGDVSIIGNLQQQGFRVSFDTANSRVGFAANQC